MTPSRVTNVDSINLLLMMMLRFRWVRVCATGRWARAVSALRGCERCGGCSRRSVWSSSGATSFGEQRLDAVEEARQTEGPAAIGRLQPVEHRHEGGELVDATGEHVALVA